MGSDSGNAKKAALAVMIAFLALLAASGCVRVQVVDSEPTPVHTPLPLQMNTAIAEEHDLAVLAIDFDPPLEYKEIIKKEGRLTLLVAVENTGICTENDVQVGAELSIDKGRTVIITQTGSIETIAPGEIKIIRFHGLRQIPIRTNYLLTVWVTPVKGEAHTANNQKRYELQITRP